MSDALPEKARYSSASSLEDYQSESLNVYSLTYAVPRIRIKRKLWFRIQVRRLNKTKASAKSSTVRPLLLLFPQSQTVMWDSRAFRRSALHTARTMRIRKILGFNYNARSCASLAETETKSGLKSEK